MKRLVKGGVACALALMCTVSALAMEVPTGTIVQNLNGVQQYIKTYTVPVEVDPQTLIEEPFEYEGCVYTYKDITKQENDFQAEKEHTETITVETKKKDLAAVLDVLEPTMEYDDGRYSGVLALDHTTIRTEPADYTSGSYTIRETKEIGNLDSNDMAYVPQTTVKDGKTINLESVDWQVQGTALVDDVLVPSRYVAVATYSGKASYSTPTGYVTTADYVGTVSCNEIKDVTYTVLYVGTEGSMHPKEEGVSATVRTQPSAADVIAAKKNISDFMTPELPYGVTSNTSIGAMEKTGMPSQTVSFGGYSIDTGGIPAAVAEVNGAKAITPNVTVTLSPTTNPTPAPTQTITVYQKTAYTDVSDMVRSDGSIGTLKIPSLGINMKVWEGETDSSMAKGIAHYSSTSGWDGNICLCGHNRGTKYAIGSIKNLRTGDTITYTTVYGTRTYEVSYVGTIANTEWSRLQATSGNRITITTCLADQPSKRVVVQAIEK